MRHAATRMNEGMGVAENSDTCTSDEEKSKWDKHRSRGLECAYRYFPSMTVNPMGFSMQLADGHDFG